MKSALRLAQKAAEMDEVPVGAVIVKEGKIIARGWNRRQQKQNALEHAEVMAIEQACRKLQSWRLEGCTLYVTLEPCPMCAGAIIQSRLDKVVFGAFDLKGGAVGSVVNLLEVKQWNHHPQWQGGILEDLCSEKLKTFFKQKREKKKASKISKRGITSLVLATEPSQNPQASYAKNDEPLFLPCSSPSKVLSDSELSASSDPLKSWKGD